MPSLEQLDRASVVDERPPIRRATQIGRRECWTWAGWEPNRYCRRQGRNGTLFFGNGSWVDSWRKRLERSETLQHLQEMGVTLLVTRFFKGFGPEVEAAEWEETKAFVRRAHKLDLKVWGYLQGGSLFGETLFLERPEARAWVARTHEGAPVTWGGAYYRFLPCLNHPEYRVFFRDLIAQGLLNLDFDGLHIDNNYFRGCYCERCSGLFREWLDRRPDLESLTGLPEAGAVSPPPAPPSDGLLSDPLRILWVAFNVETRTKFYREMYHYARSLKDKMVMCANPAFPRNLSSRRNLSFDPSLETGTTDFLFAENGSQPGWQNGMSSQVEAYLLADAGRYQVLSTGWRQDVGGYRPPKSPADIWTGVAEEFSHASAALGNNWLMRSAGNHEQMLWDTMPDLTEAFREAMAFFRDLETAIQLPRRRTWGEYGVLLNPNSLSLTSQAMGEASRILIRYLQMRRLPFRVLFSVADASPEMRHLIVCQQLALPDAEIASLLAFSKTTGKSVTTLGEVGRYNEWFTPRNEEDWLSWIAQINGKHFGLSVPKAGKTTKGHLATTRARITTDLKRSMDCALKGSHRRVVAPFQVLLNMELGVDGALFVHLRDQSGSHRVISGVRIFVQDLAPDDSLFELHAPDRSRKHCWQRTVHAISGWILLPPFERYCLLKISSPTPAQRERNFDDI